MGHGIHFLSYGESIFWTLLISGILIVFSKLALSQKNLGVPEGLQNLAEGLVEFMLGMFEPELGKKVMPLVLPFLGAFFLFILISNIFLLIPFAQCPTGDLSTTAALAVISLAGVHILSIKLKGFKKYVYDWFNPYPELTAKAEGEEEGKVGPLKSIFKKISGFLYSGMMRIIVSLLIILHVMDNCARLLSLSFRLFGNIFGEHTVYAMVSQVAMGSYRMVIPLFIPLLILLLDVLAATIQTAVFCMLSTFYLKEEAAIHH
ncbi:MAG: F0F1 ATP synthase subunit A [bacterium]|nr:F0F1 ATP synthase subunit A [bacterium]